MEISAQRNFYDGNLISRWQKQTHIVLIFALREEEATVGWHECTNLNLIFCNWRLPFCYHLIPLSSSFFFRRSTIKTRCKQQQQWQRLRHSERINEKPERETKSVHLICHWWFVELITVKPFNKSNADDLKCRRQSVTCLPFVMCVSEWFFSLARLLCSLDCLFCFFLGSSHSF